MYVMGGFVLLSASTSGRAGQVVAQLWRSVSVEQAQIAADSCRACGRGTGHRAWLNYGDTLAVALDEPLLSAGGDFGHTDVLTAG